jgi:DUF4097 and DUF4098 domain-containing protein YvlB
METMETVEKTFPTRGKVWLFVENEVGLIAITAREGDGTQVVLEADTPPAAEFVRAAAVESRTSRGRDHVIVKIPRLHGMKFIRRNGVTIRIEVPIGSDVTVKSASAQVELNGPLGAADVKTASGDVTADEVQGMDAKTASGDVEVGAVGGDLRLQTASGDLRCVKVDGRVSVKTASGEVEVGSAGDRVDVRCSSGDVRLGELAADLSVVAVSGDVQVLSLTAGRAHVRTVSGAVEVGIARGVALEVDAEAMSGTVHSDIPLNDVPGRNSAGDPKVVLTVRTVSGNILVTRAAEAFAR